ncbi:DbpA RNA binding domain-containing protein, partial [Escherichia coli]
GDLGFSGEDIGKINIHPTHAYVAVKQSIAKQVWKSLQQGKIKGKSVKVRLFR